MPVDTIPELPIPNPTYPFVAVCRVSDFNFAPTRLDLVVAHTWLKARIGNKVQVGGRIIPGPTTMESTETLYRVNLTGDLMGPFLSFMNQDRKALLGRLLVISGIPTSGLDTVNGHVIVLRSAKAWVPTPEWLEEHGFLAAQGAAPETVAAS